jgi:hypothetical protein
MQRAGQNASNRDVWMYVIRGQCFKRSKYVNLVLAATGLYGAESLLRS